MLCLACTSASQLDPPQLPRQAGAAAQPVTIALASRETPRGLVVAAHDAEIVMLAATDDGDVAVSADRPGGMRLWPRLDGTQEPVVVHSDVTPEHLAIARDGDEIVIAAAGPLGQLAVIRTTAAGVPLAHVRVSLQRTILALHATSRGFVGLRDDQRLAAVDLHGAPLGTVTTRPGERIATMASRGGRLLAVVTGEGGVRVRWIEVKQRLAWGRESPPLAIDPAHVVLAPGHDRVAALARNHRALVIVSLRDGRTLARPMTSDFEIAPARPLGFLDDHTLAWSDHAETQWWRGGALKDITFGRPRGPAVVTDRHYITTEDADLALHTFDATRYLGFRLHNVTSAVRGGAGWMISDGRTIVGVDGQLHARMRYPLPDALAAQVDALVLLDDRHCVLRIAHEVLLVDLAHPEDRVVLTSLPGAIHYEPATRLLLIGDDGTRWLGRYDAAAGQFRETLQIPGEDRTKVTDWLLLCDPAANEGNVAWRVIEEGATVRIIPIRAVDFAAATLVEGRSATRATPDELVQARGEPGALRRVAVSVMYRVMAKLVAGLVPPAAHHHISPDGHAVATVGSGRITLRDRQGDARWAITLPGVVDVRWDADALIAFGSGMAKLDLASGAVLDRRCGWDFGLWSVDEARFARGASVCEAL